MHQIGIEALDDEAHVSSQRAKSLQQRPSAVGRDLDEPQMFAELDCDLFAMFGSGRGARRNEPQRGDDVEMVGEIDFRTAALGGKLGVEIDLNEECPTCHGRFYGNYDELRHAGVALYCPFCHARFLPAEAVTEAGDLPIVLTRVGREQPELATLVEAFVEAARACGTRLDIVDVPNGQHSFDILDHTDESCEAVKTAFEKVLSRLA